MNCSSCNQALPDGAKFCLNCGQAISISCPSCGVGLPSGAKFCMACGAAVAWDPIKADTSEIIGYCAGTGKAIKSSNEHFKCIDCDKLYLEQYRFEDNPVCMTCAREQGMVEVFEQERAEQQAEEAKERQRIEEAAGKQAEAEQQAHEEAGRKQRDAEEELRRDTFTCSVTGMEFVEVAGGVFHMGDIWGEGRDDERPVHSVTLQTFLLAKYPVTQAQWEQVMVGSDPSHFKGADRPVEQVNWNDTRAFIQRLNYMGEGGFRLPTEAEWEYACRSGGKRHKWSGTDSESKLPAYGWFADNSNGSTQFIGQKEANELGLCEMSGNVWEWCEDIYNEDYEGAPSDGSSSLRSGDSRVLRGGSWYNKPHWLRSSLRNWLTPDARLPYLGFRLARNKK